MNNEKRLSFILSPKDRRNTRQRREKGKKLEIENM